MRGSCIRPHCVTFCAYYQRRKGRRGILGISCPNSKALAS